MDNKIMNPDVISWYAHESIVARMERTIKRFFILCLIMFLALVGTNVSWIIYEQQYEDVFTMTQEVDTDSAPAYVNGTGELTINGKN